MTASRPAACRRLRSLLIAVALVALAGAACKPTPPATPAVALDTWAVVDGREIKRDDVDKALRRAQGAQPPTSEEEGLATRLDLLNELIIQDILLAKARELKIEVPETEVDTAFNQAKSNMADAAFQQELTRRNLTVADMREGLRRELLTQKLLEREVGSKVTVTDEEVTAFFNSNRAQFNLPEEAYHLAQIIVTPGPDPQPANRTGDDATTPQAAAAKVQMLLERLKGGAPFADLARDFSVDPESAPRGGDLGLVPMSALKQAPAPLRDAVLNVTPGSARVVTQGGVHTIIFVVSKEAAGQRELSTPGVREQISQGLKARRQQLLRVAYLSAVQTDADVTNYLARRLVESQGKPPAAGS
jgi:peptidyl-prolyl cis-trans isomerase SurA